MNKRASQHMIPFEVWRTIPGYENYQVSDYGRVRRKTSASNGAIKAGHIIVGRISNKTGYVIVGLSGTQGRTHQLVHRLVALTFIGNPPTDQHQIAHFDGIRSNNHVGNIRWATPIENAADRERHGSTVRGARHPNAKLTLEQVLCIRARKAENQRLLAREYGVTQSAIHLIQANKVWRCVDV